MKVTITSPKVIARRSDDSLLALSEEMMQSTEELHRVFQDVVDVTHEVEEMAECMENIRMAHDVFAQLGAKQTVVEVLNTDRALESLCGSVEKLTSLKAFEDSSDAQKQSLWQRIKAAVIKFIEMIKRWLANMARKALIKHEQDIIKKAEIVLAAVKDEELNARCQQDNANLWWRSNNCYRLRTETVHKAAPVFMKVADELDKAIKAYTEFAERAAKSGYPEGMKAEFQERVLDISEAEGKLDTWYQGNFVLNSAYSKDEPYTGTAPAIRDNLKTFLKLYADRAQMLKQIQERSEKSVKGVDELLIKLVNRNDPGYGEIQAKTVSLTMNASRILMTNLAYVTQLGLPGIAPGGANPKTVTPLTHYIIKTFAGKDMKGAEPTGYTV